MTIHDIKEYVKDSSKAIVVDPDYSSVIEDLQIAVNGGDWEDITIIISNLRKATSLAVVDVKEGLHTIHLTTIPT